jgi:histidinol dehydrogenase
MQILNWQTLNSAARRVALARPAASQDARVLEQVRAIIQRVRGAGDTALLAYTQQFDGAHLQSLRVSPEEFAAARAAVPADAVAAIQAAINNVRAFHALQLGALAPLSLETQAGVRCERLARPIQSVGLYVPAGTAPLPSTVIMLAVPAALAQCPGRVLCTPPQADGTANAAVLVATQLCGISEVFKVGGAQAIAAMAYGTETVPKVAKIFGPGNAWVTAAKQSVAADPEGAALDMPAGPSEVLVIADESANAEWVAADLLAQAEHDASAQAILLTDSAPLAAAVANAVNAQLPALARQDILQQSAQHVRLIVTPSMAVALQLADDYAPEHLLLQTRTPRAHLAQIQNAGSVFLGPWSPEPMGDYCSGTNHVLPTYGYARAYSGLSVNDFVRRMTVQELSDDGLRTLGPVAVTLAELEGLGAHAAAVRKRLESL